MRLRIVDPEGQGRAALGPGVARRRGPAVGADGSDRQAYLAFIAPTVLVLSLVGAAQSTAITVSMDRHEGIVARLRTMSLSTGSILGGNVIGSMVLSLVAILVTLVAAGAMGYRPGAGPAEWAAIAGLLALASLACSWISVAMGLQAKSVETASNAPMLLMLLPFLGSGFVPVDTLPSPLAAFARYQPFTPLLDAVRGWLDGAAVPMSTTLLAFGWMLGLTLLGYAWAHLLFRRER